MVLQVALWKARGPLTLFLTNLFRTLQGGRIAMLRRVLCLQRQKWKELLNSYDSGMGLVSKRAANLWQRMEKLLERVPDNVEVPLVFYSVWGSENNVRLLTSNDNFIFNRFYDEDYTKTIRINVKDDSDFRLALGYCLHELHKPYDSIGAFCFWLPFHRQRDDGSYPSKYFCSEHVTYMLQQIDCTKI